MTALSVNPKILIFLFSAIGLITLPHVANLPIPIFAFFSALFIWRFGCIWQPKLLAPKKLLFLLTLSSFGLLFSQYQSILGRDAGTSFFILALGLKLMEINSERDLYLITYLAFIVAGSQFLYQQSILMGVYSLFVCIVLIATLVIINTPKPNTVTALKKSGSIMLQALPMTVILFVLFPRLEAPRWMIFQESSQSLTGLSEQLEPGAISKLGLSDELVFRVKFKGEIPPPKQRYWRGPVYGHTDGKRWNITRHQSVVAKHQAKLDFSGSGYEYKLMMEPQTKNWVFALDMPNKFPATLRQISTYQLVSMKNSQQRAEYQLSSNVNYNTGYLTKTEFKLNTQLPVRDPSVKIRQLIQQLGANKSNPEVFIKNLLNHFRTEKFHYTLTPPLMGARPIETFLFEQRRGFCSHYATAFVYLMRVAGIPARVVGGYQGGKINPVGGFLEVRQANAHAWTEVWIENQGWVRFDPTAAIAPERIEQGVNIEQQIAAGSANFSSINIDNSALSLLKNANMLLQSMDYSWQRWVINYNTSNQNRFLDSLGIGDLRSLFFWMLGLIAVVTIVLALILFPAYKIKQDPILRLYLRFCKKLSKVKLIRQPHETASAFAQRAIIELPAQQVQIQQITELYLTLRYSNKTELQTFKQLKQHVQQFKIQSK